MMKTKTYFYDTSAILVKEDFEGEEKIVISSYTLGELENIKNSSREEEIKFQARHLLHFIDNNPNIIDISWDYNIISAPLAGITDGKILTSACEYQKQHPEEDVYFITNDLSLKVLAKQCFDSGKILSEKPKEDEYCGYKEIKMSDEEMADFYSHLDYNKYNLLDNEYLIIKNNNGETVDSYYWNNKEHIKVPYKPMTSTWFGEVKPKANDEAQKLAIDSMMRNKLTMLTGRAGSGKSFLSLAFLMMMLEKGKIDHIIVFCNPVPTKDAAQLGLYPGTRDEKLLDSQIGNFLTSKFGGKSVIQRMLEEGTLMLLPFSDIRGICTSDMNAGIYITEAQNLNINLMKLALQRIGEDSICIIEGDVKSQVDLKAYEGNKNGMKRLSQVFRGQPFYGEVKLNTIHRSKIANLAESM